MVAEEIVPRPKVVAPDCPACGALMEVVATVTKTGEVDDSEVDDAR
jgi:hypothetical protein